MSNEDFRREINSAIDSISGSPSPALRDRVRSSLAEAPERRGPFWVAGVAAVLMAAVIVGILFVINPNRLGSIAPGGTAASPSPSAVAVASPTPSPTPSPSPVSTPVFTCASSAPLTSSQAPPVSNVDAIRTGTHAGYDRITIEFSNAQPASVEVKQQASSTFNGSPSGQAVTLAGSHGLLVIIHGADAHTAYSGSHGAKTGYAGLVEWRIVEDFEGVVQVGIGVQGPVCYRDSFLASPTRLVIDIQTS
jgi:hypothetical protein